MTKEVTTKRGRPKSVNPLKPVTFRFDADLVAHYRAMGKGWMTRMRQDIRSIAIIQGMPVKGNDNG